MGILKKWIDYGQTKEQLKTAMLIYQSAMLGSTLGFVINISIDPSNSENTTIMFCTMFIILTIGILTIIVSHLLSGDRINENLSTVEAHE